MVVCRVFGCGYHILIILVQQDLQRFQNNNCTLYPCVLRCCACLLRCWGNSASSVLAVSFWSHGFRNIVFLLCFWNWKWNRSIDGWVRWWQNHVAFENKSISSKISLQRGKKFDRQRFTSQGAAIRRVEDVSWSRDDATQHDQQTFTKSEFWNVHRF